MPSPLLVRRRLARLLPLAAVAAAALATSAPSPAHASSCTSEFQYRFDAVYQQWRPSWRCGNKVGAKLYAFADYNFEVARMNTSPSWYLCWTRGVRHAGGNNIWYWTKGDRPSGTRKGTFWGLWGYVPAVNVWTKRDPAPGMAHC